MTPTPIPIVYSGGVPLTYCTRFLSVRFGYTCDPRMIYLTRMLLLLDVEEVYKHVLHVVGVRQDTGPQRQIRREFEALEARFTFGGRQVLDSDYWA